MPGAKLIQAARSYSLTLVCVSSLKGRGRSSRSRGGGVRFSAVAGRVWACVTGVGVQAERPQRSEDERPGCRRG